MQLRTIDGAAALRSDRAGLIRTLASNKNSEAVIDGVTLNNTTTAGNATEINLAPLIRPSAKYFRAAPPAKTSAPKPATIPTPIFQT